MGYYNDFKKKAVRKWEIKVFHQLVKKYDWNMCELSRQIKMDRGNLLRKLKKLGIRRPE